jgi:hypothetical protein
LHHPGLQLRDPRRAASGGDVLNFAARIKIEMCRRQSGEDIHQGTNELMAIFLFFRSLNF